MEVLLVKPSKLNSRGDQEKLSKSSIRPGLHLTGIYYKVIVKEKKSEKARDVYKTKKLNFSIIH